jgi:hypothetical protein
MLLDVVQLKSSLFNHFPKTKRLVAEISDTGIHFFQQLYDDAADVGFSVRNEKTGNVTRWSLSDEVRDRNENELIGWTFVPTPESLRANPTLKGYMLTLLND